MAGVVDRINARLLGVDSSSRDVGFNLSFDDWAAMFSFGGVAYPLIQTTMGSIKEERIPVTAIAAFETNAAVFALTIARLQAFTQARFAWTRFAAGKPSGDFFGDPPSRPGQRGGTELGVLEHPWPGGSTAKLLAKMEIDNSIAGNAYIVRPRRDRLARLRPDRVIICLGSQTDAEVPSDAPDVEVAGYFHWPQSGRGKAYLPDEVAHYAPIPDPTFQFLGISWMTAAVREIQGDSLMTEHKNRFMTNAATPNLAIKFDPTIPIEMVRAFKKEMEHEHKGAWNAYKTLYLGGGADPVPVGKDFQQIAFSDTQGHGESRLAAAAGVPSSWVGFSEGLQGSSLNAGNFQSARRRFSDGTMQHLWTEAAGALETILNKPDSGATLWFDTAHAPFMREDAQDIATIQVSEAQVISTLVQQGFDPDSVVAAVRNNDWRRLKHTGMLSVQLHPPGTAAPALQAPRETASIGSGSESANGNGRAGSRTQPPEPPDADAADAAPTPGPSGLLPVPADAKDIYSAHRLDDIAVRLRHSQDRLKQAKAAVGNIPLRRYHLGHIRDHLAQALEELKLEDENLHKNYPAEWDELNTVNDMITMRAKSVSPTDKVGTFSHLAQAIAFHLTHASRHCERAITTSSDPVWQFNYDHLDNHLCEAASHNDKLIGHVRDNYPPIWEHLKTLTSAKPAVPSGRNGQVAATVSSNGNGGGG